MASNPVKALFVALFCAMAALFNTAAHAALPTEVTTAISTYSTDALAAAGLILGAGVGIWGIRKIGQKFGWF